eukprot:CAMPEP_0206448668 /NCGR_PEP_ID=MMETSP0324_2-20121206/17613_1 /ASSEMBLY_ACC=CAM_ASM_000836 /TAXON_ID=2866 /ORGANISM="Crypthecodinium cohnii, Strain Seligo" /LENGTH=190 /DNA_ID=CAMNT_0053917863 /DNA_START=117 /DNA_END=689 /DNA_ORIENTATION=+
MFQDKLDECRYLAAQASEELKQIASVPERERAARSNSIFNLLKQADDNLASLQLEAKSAQSDERARLSKEEEVLRGELRVMAQELQRVRRELLLPDAGHSGSTAKLFLSKEERRRSAAVTQSLQRATDRLRDSNKTMAETEHIGVETLQELRRQREVMHRVQDRTNDLGQNLDSADKAVKELEQPQCCMM